MASSYLFYKNRCLPSTPHPISSQVEEHLRRARSNSAAASTSPSSISQQISGLQDLHECVGDLLLLPSTKQSIAHVDSINMLLDGSLRLLDACSVINHALLQTKDSKQQVQSVLRRRCEAQTQSEAKKFMSARKAVKKAMSKALKNLKHIGVEV